MEYITSYLEVGSTITVRVHMYKTHLGFFYIRHFKTGLEDIIVKPFTIYRDPSTGVIVAYAANYEETIEGALIIYPDKTKRFIKDMTVNQAVQQFIFKSNN